MSRRRGLTWAVLACLVGSAATLFAASRGWAVTVTDRPGVLPDLRQVRTGAALVTWLPAVALVGLAGGGALLATRGLARRLLGLVEVATGGAVVSGALVGLLGVDRGAAGPLAAAWPVVCLAGGLFCVAGGAAAARYGAAWPAMGARYERGGASTTGRAEPAAPGDTRDTWAALDRGEDPTVR